MDVIRHQVNPKSRFQFLGHRNPLQVQGVHKDSLQFQKFITKANERTDRWKLLQNETCIFKFSFVSFNTPLYGRH